MGVQVLGPRRMPKFGSVGVQSWDPAVVSPPAMEGVKILVGARIVGGWCPSWALDGRPNPVNVQRLLAVV